MDDISLVPTKELLEEVRKRAIANKHPMVCIYWESNIKKYEILGCPTAEKILDMMELNIQVVKKLVKV